MPEFFDGFCSLQPGTDPEGRMRGMQLCILPPAIFKNAFNAYNFSIISNLFDSNKPYALSTHMENVRTKCIIFSEALRFRVKKFSQNLPENYSRSTKIAITACKFSKFFRGACPRTPPALFHFFESASNLFCRKNNKYLRLKNCGNYAPPPPPLQFLATPLVITRYYYYHGTISSTPFATSFTF